MTTVNEERPRWGVGCFGQVGGYGLVVGRDQAYGHAQVGVGGGDRESGAGGGCYAVAGQGDQGGRLGLSGSRGG